MKKIILSIVLLLSVNALFAQSANKANGGKITEGTITYAVQWNLPEQMKAMASNFPSELKVYFKGDSASLKTESQMFSSTAILNTNKDYERMLLDVPMMGKKFSIMFTPEDKEKLKDKMPDLTLKPGTETKTVAGYKATKFDVNEKKSNQNSEAWFTKDVEIVQNPLTRFYDKNYGFPVQFTSYLNGVTVNATVKEIKPGTVPAGIFSASKDYEEITFDQLMQMSGGQ